jgi:hypothetical protein
MLGQAAERVLQGEVPHRDFDEPYTGLLTYVHAAAFTIGGIRSPVLRVPLFLLTLLWIAAVYRIALRFANPGAAAAIALTALAWSVPNYPASMPSWYNLFFATFGILALMRWVGSREIRWLLWAGAAGGVSFLFKLSGLFYVAGALLFLLYALPEERGGKALAGIITLGLLLLVLALWWLIAPIYWPRVIYHFVLPGAVIALALVVREWRLPSDGGGERAKALVRVGAPFLAGVALPILLFAAGFAAAGALPALMRGVFVAPLRRLAYANMPPPAPFWALAALPLVVLLRPRADWNATRWRKAGVVVVVLFALILIGAWEDRVPHRLVWQSLLGDIPLVALIAAGVIALPRLTAEWTPEGRLHFVLLASVTALAGLIQFPYSAPIYFLYVFPLLLLTVAALLGGMGRTPRPLAAATLGFYAMFGVLVVVPSSIAGLGYFRPELWTIAETLDLPRSRLRVLPEEAELYETLIPELEMRAQGGSIWAGPDAPEIYFWGGFRNHSRAIFDFLGFSNASLEGLPAPLNQPDVRAIVVNLRPLFSAPLSTNVLDALRLKFPEGRVVGHFELRWKK